MFPLRHRASRRAPLCAGRHVRAERDRTQPPFCPSIKRCQALSGEEIKKFSRRAMPAAPATADSLPTGDGAREPLLSARFYRDSEARGRHWSFALAVSRAFADSEVFLSPAAGWSNGPEAGRHCAVAGAGSGAGRGALSEVGFATAPGAHAGLHGDVCQG